MQQGIWAGIVLVVISATPIVAQEGAQPRIPAGDCFLSMRGGAGAFHACLSPTGNLTRWTTAGVEHLDVGWAIEGWRICRLIPALDPEDTFQSWDTITDVDAGREGTGPADDGGDRGATWYTQPNGPGTWPFTVTHQFGEPGEHAALRLTQFFSRNTSTRTVTIKMRVTNLSPRVSGIGWIQRLMDVDADGTPDDDVALTGRDFAMVTSSAGGGRGVILTADNTALGHDAMTGAWSFPFAQGSDFQCGGDAEAAAGDSTIAVTYGTPKLKPGSSYTVSFTYRAF
jgi:hypothetical protein